MLGILSGQMLPIFPAKCFQNGQVEMYVREHVMYHILESIIFFINFYLCSFVAVCLLLCQRLQEICVMRKALVGENMYVYSVLQSVSQVS